MIHLRHNPASADLPAIALGAEAGRPQKPVIAITRARVQARETQADLVRLLWAALFEQQRFVRAFAPAALEAARQAFANRSGALFPAGLPLEALERHASRVAELVVAARVLGRLRIRREAELPLRNMHMAEQLRSVGIERAVDYLKQLNVVTREEWDALSQAERARAFTISGIEREQVLRQMQNLVARGVREGWTETEFLSRARQAMTEFELTAGRMRTVWNTNLGSALARGRQEELDDPEVRSVVSWRLFDAYQDFRTRPNHRVLDNGAAPADWWETVGANLRPLLGFNCRCVLIGITEARALSMIRSGEARDLQQGIPLGAGPDAGFERRAA